jgi:hypothetical protein
MAALGKIIQYLKGTSDGLTVTDSVNVVRPLTSYTKANCITLVGASFGYGLLSVPHGAVDEYELEVSFRSTAAEGDKDLCYVSGALVGLRMNGTTNTLVGVHPGGSTVSGVLADLTNGAWHTAVVRVSTTSMTVWYDGDPVIEQSGIFDLSPAPIDLFVGAGALAPPFINADFSRLKLTVSPSTSPTVIFDSYLSEGGTSPHSFNRSSYAPDLVLTYPGTVLDTMWITSDDIPDIASLKGYDVAFAFNGNEYIRRTGANSAQVNSFAMTLWVTGDPDQVIASPDFTAGFYNITINSTQVGGPYAIISNNYTSGTMYTPSSSLSQGWHSIRWEWNLGLNKYDFWLDDVQQTVLGNLSTRWSEGNFAICQDVNGTYPTIITDCSMRTSSSNFPLVLEGTPREPVDWTRVIDDFEKVFVPRKDDGTAILSDGLYGTGGNVANFHSTMIANSVDIVDYCWVSDGINSGPLARTNETTFQGLLLPAGVTCTLTTDIPGFWIISAPFLTSGSSGQDGPLPPTTNWTNGWVVQHGYNGSFWVDADGEFIEQDAAVFQAHPNSTKNLCLQWAKNSRNICEVKQAVQYTMEKESFTPEEEAVIIEWQGDATCGVPLT